MERKFVYFCPNCNEYRKYNPNQSNKFICKICGNKMLYKGMEDKDERKQLKKIYIQNELEKEKKKKQLKRKLFIHLLNQKKTSLDVQPVTQPK